MRSAPKLKPEYVIDINGNKKAVILSIEEYEELIEDLRDLAVLAERREEPVIPHADVVAELKRNGYLPN
jgi:PHD/YefM family antitoxin component YafN of YafNO toxin-antitoxin module